MRCEALDELEEFALLIRHCVATLLSHCRCASASPGATKMAYFVGLPSPMGFQEGRCTAMKRSDRFDERGGCEGRLGRDDMTESEMLNSFDMSRSRYFSLNAMHDANQVL